jgi:hypothetical protein
MIGQALLLPKNARLTAGVFVCALLLNGCASLFFPQAASLSDSRPADLPASAELKDVPFFPADRVPVRSGRARHRARACERQGHAG